jgi:hypothetical protein
MLAVWGTNLAYYLSKVVIAVSCLETEVYMHSRMTVVMTVDGSPLLNEASLAMGTRWMCR